MSNDEAYREACKFFPGGVNSPVRAFKAVGGIPFTVKSGQGAYLYDVEGKAYIDYINSWGPLVLGHAHPVVVEKIYEQAKLGTSYGANSNQEVELAKIIKKFFPSIELIRFVSSGTEAGMAVIRLARGFTGKKKILKFSGCYHGHADALLVSAGSGLATFGIPGSAGVNPQVTHDTLTVSFNDIEAVKKIFETFPDEIAAVIVEPVCGNAGFILPETDFLKELRAITESYKSLLVFDEVMTGFRVSLNGAQGIYKIKPDLTMLGKVIGGGLPVGAFGGKKEIMEELAPLGPVYQAGTLSGNPLAMSAGIATLEEWTKPGIFEQVSAETSRLVEGFKTISKRHNIALTSNSLGTMFGFFFSANPVKNYDQAQNCDLEKFKLFFREALEAGVYFAPSQFEAGFVSAAHTKSVIDETLAKLEIVFQNLNQLCTTKKF